MQFPHTTNETISSSTQGRAAPANIASGVAAAKAVTPQRAFIFDFLRTTPQIERCYMKVSYSTQFNPQLSLVPHPQAELDPSECVGAFDGDVNGSGQQQLAGDRKGTVAADGGAAPPDASVLPPPDVSGAACPAPYDASTVKSRSLFSMSPAERPPGQARSLASGRELSELEALGRKHAEEMMMLVPPIVDALRNVMNNHDNIARSVVKDDRHDCFNTVSAVVTSLQEYIARLSEWCYVSPSTFIIACIFLDRMLFKYPRLLFSRQNIYKYYGVALRIANKCVDVKNISNKNYAHVIGVSNVHLNDLEAKLLMDLRFGLYVSPAEFFWYARRLVPYHPAVQRLLSRNGPTMEAVSTALAMADRQATCRQWPNVSAKPIPIAAALSTAKRSQHLQHQQHVMLLMQQQYQYQQQQQQQQQANHHNGGGVVGTSFAAAAAGAGGSSFTSTQIR